MIDKKMCCGCAACFNICPQKCISMVEDKEGFLYPVTDKSKCTNCGLCEKVCPALKKGDKQADIDVYACKNKNYKIQRESSSGGAFSVFAEYVLEQGGIVFGAVFNNEFKVVHDFIDNSNQLYKLRGSKYVQSDIGESYKKAREFLNMGRLVLFSGTSCQIAGLKNYLVKSYENLICIDVICHGVPSPFVFQKYIEERKEQHNENIRKISFRDKTNSWGDFSMKIEFENQVYRKTVSQDEYLRGFVHNLYLRPCCYNCNYKNFTCGSDISLADFWGIKNILPDFYDENGVSLVLVNSDIGRKIFEEIKDRMKTAGVSLENALLANKAIIDSPKKNKRRKEFFKGISSQQTVRLINKCMRVTVFNKINLKLYRLIRKGAKKL